MSFLTMKSVAVIGVMSGTSLDGLDLCYVRFDEREGQWVVNNLITKAVDYSDEWRADLNDAFNGEDGLIRDLHDRFGTFIGECVLNFMKENNLTDQVDLIASHGHTIFHEPAKGVTLQIGNGQKIADITSKLVVSDFRKKDVELGGQGAPLVPLGDKFLFANYEACLNLGGIANISFEHESERVAFDICPCNLPLNKIMRSVYKREFDKNGDIARSGKVNDLLLAELNELGYYQQKFPKSLGVEWLNSNFYPVLNNFKYNNLLPENVLRTIVEHETLQIASILNLHQIKSVLVTGGGAFNGLFIDELKSKTKTKVMLPSDEIIGFKEALIFAFLGLRTVRGEINALKSVTGATQDSVGGVISHPSTVQNFEIFN